MSTQLSISFYNKFFLICALSFFSYFDLADASQHPYISEHGIVFSSGNKYLQEIDVAISSPGQLLTFSRAYNSQNNANSELGFGWISSYGERLSDMTASQITLIESNGRAVRFVGDAANGWRNQTGSERVITVVGGGYQLKDPDGAIKLFSEAGRILSSIDINNNAITYKYNGNKLTVSDNFGHSFFFVFNDITGMLDTLTSAAGTIKYGYENGNLATVTRQGEKLTTYLYEDPLDPHNLTGIVESEILADGTLSGKSTRICTVEYDNQDRVVRSVKTGGQKEIRINYIDADTREITQKIDNNDVVSTYELEFAHGIARVKSYIGPGCSSCGEQNSSSYTYNDRFQVERITNAEGIITYYQYDANGNKRFVTEAEGTELERTTEYTYWPGTHLVWQVKKDSLSNPGQQHITTRTYDSSGNLQTETETGFADTTTSLTRTTTFTHTNGQLATIDGPRTDVNDITTFTYYPNTQEEGFNRGQLHTVENGLGQIFTFSEYNGLGRPERIVDANTIATTFKYNSRDQVIGKTTRARSIVYC